MSLTMTKQEQIVLCAYCKRTFNQTVLLEVCFSDLFFLIKISYFTSCFTLLCSGIHGVVW